MNAPCDHFTFRADDPLTNSLGLGSAALRYAGLGYAVIPLARGGKRPHRMLGDRGGIHLASRDPQVVYNWWRSDIAANIGVATGSVNSLMVIDLDVKGGSNGPMELESFLAAYPLTLPYDVVARTPSGGWHLWLRAYGEVPERPGIRPGVDVKGDGGLVVAPPSLQVFTPDDRSGGTTGEVTVPYEWVQGCPHAVPDAPPWSLDWIAHADPAPRENAHASTGDTGKVNVAGAVEHGVAVGSRNREIYRIACRLYREHGTHPDGARIVRETVRSVWERTDQHDFPWREVMVCIESARRFIEREVERERLPLDRMASFSAWLDGRFRLCNVACICTCTLWPAGFYWASPRPDAHKQAYGDPYHLTHGTGQVPRQGSCPVAGLRDARDGELAAMSWTVTKPNERNTTVTRLHINAGRLSSGLRNSLPG